MKTITFKSLVIAAIIAAVASLGASAQTRNIEQTYSEFNSISVADGFKVTIVAGGETYNSELRVESSLADYVQCFVRSNTLSVGLDSKSIPSEVKKSFKGKNATPPTLEATIYVPSLKELTLNDEAVVICDKPLEVSDFKLTMSGDSKINALTITAKSDVQVNLEKKSQITSLNIQAKDIKLSASGNAKAGVDFKAETFTFSPSASSELTLNGKAGSTAINTAGGPAVTMTGESTKLVVSGSGSSAKVDATGYIVQDAEMSFDGATVSITAEKTLKLNLGRGASLTYAGDPFIDLESIKNASVSRK